MKDIIESRITKELEDIEDIDEDGFVDIPEEESVSIKKRGRPPLSPEEKAKRDFERSQRIVDRVPEIVCIRINPSKFHLEESEQSIYERTRGAWRTGSRAFAAKYVLAAITGKYSGLITNKIVAIYDVQSWGPVNPAGYTTRSADEFVNCENRVEFVGTPTQNPELQSLVGKIFHPAQKLNGSNPISFREISTIMEVVIDIPVEGE